MRVFVLGAGVSRTVGYPLGNELIGQIDQYVRAFAPLRNRFDYDKDWSSLCQRLENNENPLVAMAYRRQQLEHLFTVLDLSSIMRTDALLGVFYSSKLGPKAVAKAESLFERHEKMTEGYREDRRILLWALEDFFEYKHHEDSKRRRTSDWGDLESFGRKLCAGDVVITFNYDSTIERVLYGQGKWSPRDGYGFDLVFQKSDFDEATVPFDRSGIMVLHLHGAIGWFRKPVMNDEYSLPEGGGAIPREAFTPAPLETEVSLGPRFSRDLGIHAVDASLPQTPPQDKQIVLHPSCFQGIRA